MIEYQIVRNENEGFKLWSSQIHGSITLPLSIFGCIFNFLTIIIFLQKSMRTNTNLILMSISIFDILLMLAYIPYTIHFFLLGTPDPTPDQLVFWPYYALIYSHFSLFTHGCSVWLTCFLAFYRYVTVTSCVQRGTFASHAILNKNRIKLIMLVLIVMVFACMSVNVISYDIQKSSFLFTRHVDTLSTNETFNVTLEQAKYDICSNETYNSSTSLDGNSSQVVCFDLLWMQESRLSQNNPFILRINFWIHAIVFRTLPCILLLILSIMLIYVMKIANENRMKLIQQGRKSEYEKAGEFNRTTTMLLIVVVSFLIMEFPHGILYIICAFSENFFRDVYVSLGDLLDLLVLINSSINFFLYCCMSSQFRFKFQQVFCLFILPVKNVKYGEDGTIAAVGNALNGGARTFRSATTRVTTDTKDVNNNSNSNFKRPRFRSLQINKNNLSATSGIGGISNTNTISTNLVNSDHFSNNSRINSKRRFTTFFSSFTNKYFKKSKETMISIELHEPPPPETEPNDDDECCKFPITCDDDLSKFPLNTVENGGGGGGGENDEEEDDNLINNESLFVGVGHHQRLLLPKNISDYDLIEKN